MYESELTRFIRDLKERNPQIAELQRKNRATWWDKPQDFQAWKERAESTVAQPGYVYFPLPRAGNDDDPDSATRLGTPSRRA
jgi:hypothetical protein